MVIVCRLSVLAIKLYIGLGAGRNELFFDKSQQGLASKEKDVWCGIKWFQETHYSICTSNGFIYNDENSTM